MRKEPGRSVIERAAAKLKLIPNLDQPEGDDLENRQLRRHPTRLPAAGAVGRLDGVRG